MFTGRMKGIKRSIIKHLDKVVKNIGDRGDGTEKSIMELSCSLGVTWQ